MIQDGIQQLGQIFAFRRERDGFLGLLLLTVLFVTACSNSSSSVAPKPTSVVAEQQAATPLIPSKTGSEKYLRFERISLEQGLSQSSIYCMLQDIQGFMWFGTEDGLNKYDGYNFTVYRPIPGDPSSLSQNFIRAIHEDSSGVLWVGTDDGLDRFDRQTGKFTYYRHDPDDPYSLSNHPVESIFQDREGALWVGTLGGGLYKFDQEQERFIRYQVSTKQHQYIPSSDVIWVIYQDQEGTLWVGTDNGLGRLDHQTGQFDYYRTNSSSVGSRGSSVRAIYEDESGVLWIGTLGGGLKRFDRFTERFVSYVNILYDPHSLSNDLVWAIHQDQDGVLWIGTDSGLNLFDRDSEQFIHFHHDSTDPNSLGDNSVRAIHQDPSGVLWIGTYGGGISKLDRSTDRFTHYKNDPWDPNSLNTDAIRAIYKDQEGMLWIGTAGGGLNKFDRRRGTFTFYTPGGSDDLSHHTVRAIQEDSSGVLWVGTQGGGLNRFDRSKERFTHYYSIPQNSNSLSNDTILSMLQDRAGILWIGTQGGGLNRFDPSTERFTQYYYDPHIPGSLSSNDVRAIYEDRAGILWIGTWNGGLNKFDPETEKFTPYHTYPQGLSDDTVLSIHEDLSGMLWVGTAGGGLNKFDRETKTFVHYREKDGLPNDVIYGILEDGRGHLWLSTNKGLSKFDPQTETFTNYDVHDGLQGNEFNGGAYHRSRDGEMFFGGLSGMTAFYPAFIKDNAFVPPVVLTLLTQGGEDVRIDPAFESVKEIVFRWPNNFFEFEFAVLSYTQPEKNQYAYKLEGLKEDWNYIGTRRFGRYTSLPGGTYTLRIKGSNNDGVWNEEGTAITIKVVPPFWATWWFRVIVVFVLVGGVVGGYRWRVRDVEVRSRELEAQVEQRTAELRQEVEQRAEVEEALRQSEMAKAVAAERSRLARDLHDVVTQTLFSASLVAEALPTSWERDREEGRQLLKELRQLTQGALAEMRTLLLELRPAALIEAKLGDLLRQLAEGAIGREGIPITVTVEGGCSLPSDVHITLYRIAQESLNNVTKHARANRVTMSLRCVMPQPLSRAGEGKTVTLSIHDDGCGFDPDCVPTDRLGLNGMRERAQTIGAALTIDSEIERGTEIVVVWNGLTEQEVM
ncbi:MAG: histidine kinase [Chloroflexi bacterium]|nr:histidine kinase [Chloroflexota bacterium]